MTEDQESSKTQVAGKEEQAQPEPNSNPIPVEIIDEEAHVKGPSPLLLMYTAILLFFNIYFSFLKSSGEDFAYQCGYVCSGGLTVPIIAVLIGLIFKGGRTSRGIVLAFAIGSMIHLLSLGCNFLAKVGQNIQPQ